MHLLDDIEYWQLNPRESADYLRRIAAYHAHRAARYADRARRGFRIATALWSAALVLEVAALWFSVQRL